MAYHKPGYTFDRVGQIQTICHDGAENLVLRIKNSFETGNNLKKSEIPIAFRIIVWYTITALHMGTLIFRPVLGHEPELAGEMTHPEVKN